jgi:hypothetical protein
MAEGLPIDPGRNTFWAPEVVWNDGVYHMFVSYIRGVHEHWDNPKAILHYTSPDLWNWRFGSALDLQSNRVIDACVLPMGDGTWKLWYKDEEHGSHTWVADSPDLYRWAHIRPAVTDCAHEGPNVFYWHNRYWMVTDEWRGLGVYVSEDAEQWTKQEERILYDLGVRRDDNAEGHHADVVVQGDAAYIFYFTHPGKMGRAAYEDDSGIVPYQYRRSSIQVARLTVENGQLICNRDEAFILHLQDPMLGNHGSDAPVGQRV